MNATATKLEYLKAEPISLKSHPDFSEVWLHEPILKDTSILGLGELDVLKHELVQAGAGRLDMLLTDSDADSPTRYEVEIMLGLTDPSHLIRTIEYWDIERRRYPAYDHIRHRTRTTWPYFRHVIEVPTPVELRATRTMAQHGLRWISAGKHRCVRESVWHRRRCASRLAMWYSQHI